MTDTTAHSHEINAGHEKHTIVMMDDNMSVLKMFYAYFHRHGYNPIPVRDPRHLGRKIRENNPDAILMDIKMNDARGDEIVKLLRRKGCQTPIFVVSGYINQELIARLKNYNVAGYFSKPVPMKMLQDKITQTIEEFRYSRDTRTSQNETGSAIIISEARNFRDNPERVIPMEIAEEFMLDIHTVSSVHEAIDKKVAGLRDTLKLILVDAISENNIQSMTRILQAMQTKTGVPVCLFSTDFSDTFKRRMTRSGLEHFLQVTEIPTSNALDLLRHIMRINRKSSPAIQEAVNKTQLSDDISSRPSLSETFHRVEELADNRSLRPNELKEVLDSDSSISKRLLFMANSAYYGLDRKIKTIKELIAITGNRELLMMIRLACIIDALKTDRDIAYAVGKIWAHSAAVAITARILLENAETGTNREDALLAGIIHDLGKVITWQLYPDVYMNYLIESKSIHFPSLETEKSIMGITHTDIGVKLANHWKLPGELHDIIAFHHTPDVRPDNELLGLVYVADKISDIIAGKLSDKMNPDFDIPTLEHFGLSPGKTFAFAESHANEIKKDIALLVRMIAT